MSPVVDVRVWRVRRAGPALLRVARGRRTLRAPGLRFGRLLGTGRGETFTPRDADLHQWAMVTVWDDDRAARAARELAAPWDDAAHERLHLVLAPLASRGRWGGVEPFGTPAGGAGTGTETGPTGPVASLTRARIRPSRAREFYRAVPGVVDDLHAAPGLRLAFGFGEAPVLLQGTLSVWDSAAALRDFAHRTAAHREAVRRTPRVGWYSEELFARLAVEHAEGSLRGRTP